MMVPLEKTEVTHAEDGERNYQILPSELTTDTWAVFDPETGVVLDGRNLGEIHPIASITKLFTGALVMKSVKKDEKFIILANDTYAEGRSGKLIVGMDTTPHELLFPLLIESSNDAGVAIERFFGSEFDLLMTSLVGEIGLRDTLISEPTGLSPKNVSTITDLALFYSRIKESVPLILDITKLNTYIDARTGYVNNNPLQKNKRFIGGKQGYTDEAKYTFVGAFESSGARSDVGIAILKSSSLEHDVLAILEAWDDVQ